jgi:hypothetical protein
MDCCKCRAYRCKDGETELVQNTHELISCYVNAVSVTQLRAMLIKYETDPELKSFYQNLMDEWIAKQTAGENLYNNLAYTFATGKKINVQQTINFLKDTPLDLVDWHIDHTLREDVSLIRSPILEEIQL